MPEDAELLRRYARERSEEAFAALVHRHLSLVYQAALRRTDGDTHLAEDVAQVVFADLARNAVSLQHHAVLAGWLYVATRHAAANAMRTEKRRKLREQQAVAMNDPSTPGVSGSSWSQLRPELDSVMDELTEAEREAVLLRYFENRPYAEIGAALRLSEDAARMRVDRALERLRLLLSRRGITSTAAALGGLIAAQSAVAAPTGLATAVTGSVLAGTGVAAAATGSTGFIAFMMTTKTAWGVAGFIALVAGGSAVYQFQVARQASSELALLRGEQAKLRQQLQEREEQARAAQARRTELEKDLAAKEREANDRQGNQSVAKASPASSAAGGSQVNLWADPEYMRLFMKVQELGLKHHYGPLYRRLGWSEEKIRAFERLKLQQLQDQSDILAAAGVAGVDLDNSALSQLLDPAWKQTEESLRRLIGEEDLTAYVQFGDERMAFARAPAETLASNFHFTETPLTLEQYTQLTQLILENTPKPVRANGAGFPPGANWDSIYAQAAAILTPRQLDTLRGENERNETSREFAALNRKLGESAAAAPKSK